MAAGQCVVGNKTGKGKRVRTGCLTCRERHLKCDEGVPICYNCRKSNRVCKKGIRLNFIDTVLHEPSVLAVSDDWSLGFIDESRDIASEYVNGLERYGGIVEPSASSCGSGSGSINGSGGADDGNGELERQDRLGLGFELGLDLELGLGYRDPVSQLSGRRDISRTGDTGCENIPTKTDQSISTTSHDTIQGLGMEFDFATDLGLATATAAATASTSHVGNTFEMGVEVDVNVGMAMDMNLNHPPASSITSSANAEPGLDLAVTSAPNVATNQGSDINSHIIGMKEAYSMEETIRMMEEERLHTNAPNCSKTKRERHNCVNNEEEIYLLAIFVERVASILDLFGRGNEKRYFSEIITIQAIEDAGLLNACIACGANEVWITRGDEYKEMADRYMKLAMNYFIKMMEDKDVRSNQGGGDNGLIKDTIIRIIIIASILVGYEELMKGARLDTRWICEENIVLLKQVSWNFQLTGVGCTCFWLEFSIEILKAWETGTKLPSTINLWKEWKLEQELKKRVDDSTLNNSISLDSCEIGQVDLWLQTILAFAGKVADLNGAREENKILHEKDLQYVWDQADWIEKSISREFRPLAFFEGSKFWRIWLLNEKVVIARLFYHTALYLLLKMGNNPNGQTAAFVCEPNLRPREIEQVYTVCGIIGNVKDYSRMAKFYVRILTLTTKQLTESDEQTEVLQILRNIEQASGFSTAQARDFLRSGWRERARHYSAYYLPENGNFLSPRNGNDLVTQGYFPKPWRKVTGNDSAAADPSGDVIFPTFSVYPMGWAG